MTRTGKLVLLLVFWLELIFFSAVARHRLVHIDEGFYLVASRLVLAHQRPYLEFFYTQAPLLPYAYALWLKCFGITWISARFLAVLLTSFLGVLLCEHVCHETRNLWAGVAAVV